MPPSDKLTEVKIKNIKPNGKIERFADGEGLYLETSVAGGKFWRMKYRGGDGKEKRLSFGEYVFLGSRKAVRYLKMALPGRSGEWDILEVR